jgi:6-methylsalicylate decarboxylase
MRVDVHQHLWTPLFLDALRRRRDPPRLDGWTLHLDGQPQYAVGAADHDVAARAEFAATDGLDLVLVSLSSPLGIEWLPAAEAAPLLAAYHDGALALPAPFRPWAAACLSEIDAAQVEKELDRGCVGLQLPATALADPAGYARCAPLLDLLERRARPLFVHPGAAPPAPAGAPAWWAALVPYVQQMHAAWYAFRGYGRSRNPALCVCFAMLAGLAPLHGERLAARGGGKGAVDRDAFLDTSSYGPRTVDAAVRALGIDVLVHGSDRPYANPANPADLALGDAAAHALRVANPVRLLDTIDLPGPPDPKGDRQ